MSTIIIPVPEAEYKRLCRDSEYLARLRRSYCAEGVSESDFYAFLEFELAEYASAVVVAPRDPQGD